MTFQQAKAEAKKQNKSIVMVAGNYSGFHWGRYGVHEVTPRGSVRQIDYFQSEYAAYESIPHWEYKLGLMTDQQADAYEKEYAQEMFEESAWGAYKREVG